jgi:uncharacterized membrane protein YbjE (DUF340 family)
MIIVLSVMLAGICMGLVLTRYPNIIRINDKLVSWAIYLLLFLLGVSVGINETIIHNLDQIGLQAAIITLGAVSGSVFVSWFVYRYWFKPGQHQGAKHEE